MNRLLPALSLVALSALASTANAARLQAVSPGPPSDPSDYLEIQFTFDAELPHLKARAVGLVQNVVSVIDNTLWLPIIELDEGPALPADGRLEMYWSVEEFGPGSAIVFDFEPDLDRESIDAHVGLNVNGHRAVSVTGAGGYSRSFVATEIPEPSGAVLIASMLLGLASSRTRVCRGGRPIRPPVR